MADPLSQRRVSWTRRLAGRWRSLARAALRLPGEENRGRLLRSVRNGRLQLRRSGPAARVSLGLLLVLTAVTAGVLVGNGGGGGTRSVSGQAAGPWASWVPVVLAGLVWAAGTAAAAALPLWGFALAALWLAWSGLLLMAAWAGTPLVALPVLWLLVVGLAVGARRGADRGWAAFPPWLALCMGAGYLLSGPAGLSQILGIHSAGRDWAGALLVAAVAAPAWSLGSWCRRRRWMEPSFGRVFAGGALVMGLGLMASGFRDGEATRGWAAAVMEDTAYAAMLAWFWLAGGFALSLLKLTEWTSWVTMRGLTLRGVSRIFPWIWAVVTLLEWLGTHKSAEPWMNLIGPGRLDHWMASWPWEIRVAAWGHAWAGVVVLVTGAGFLWQGREGARLLPRLHGLWLASFFCILAVSPVLASFMSPLPEHAGRFWWWAPLVLLGGIAQDLGQAKRNWRGELSGGLGPRLGWRLVMLGVLLGLEWRNEIPWPTAGGVVALLGMLHLALPRALHQWWTRGHSPEEGLPVSSQIWISAAGMISVLPMLRHNPGNSGVLAFAPVVWLPVLLWLRCHRPGLAASSGALAGALLGSGTVAAWCRPALLLPDVPLLSFLNAPAAVTTAAGALAERPFLDSAHFTLLLLLSGCGAVLGAVVFRSRPPAGEIPIAIAQPAA